MYETDNSDKIVSTSDDGQGEVLDKAKEKAIRQMIRSNNKIDQRLINMTRVKYAHRAGVNVGFNAFDSDENNKIDEETEEVIVLTNNSNQRTARKTPTP